MISIDGLAVELAELLLFSDISFRYQTKKKDRIAPDGVKKKKKMERGKSTLLKILAGVRQPTPWKNLSPQGQCHSLPSTAPYDGRRTYRIPGSGASLCPPA